MRRKKGEVREALLRILSEVYPETMRFYLLRERLEERLKDGKISNKVISDSLKKLEKEGQVEKTRDGWREIRFYPESRARNFIQKILDEPAPINVQWTGHSLTPCFEIGHGGEKYSSPPHGLETATRERFGLEVKKLLADAEEREKNLITDFFASALWLGYKSFIPHLPKESEFKNPIELFESNVKSEVGKHYLVEYISQGTRNYFENKISISEYKLLLLAYAMLELIHGSVIRTPVSEKANLARMSQSEIVLDFMEKVDGIKFAYLLAVGFEDLDRELAKLIRLQHFDRWIKEIDKHPEWELEIVKKAMKEAAERVEHGMPLKEELLPFINLTLKDIYELHPRGKDPSFYLKIVEMIFKALKVKEKGPRVSMG